MAGRPHDSLFKAAFEQPDNAAALARCNLSASVAACFDWSTMRLVSGSFVDEQLAHRYTDLLFEVDTELGNALVYLLFEHQSSNDPRMPLRMSRYMDRIWARFDGDHPTGPLPPIIPLLICHAPEGWTSPRSFHELFSPSLFERGSELGRFVPDFQLLVDDLRRTSDDDLASRALAAFAKVALWLLRDGRVRSRLVEKMPKWVGLLDGLPRPWLAAIVNYLSAITNDPMIWDAFRVNLRKLAPRAEEDVMTLAEQWFNQGRAEGEAKGRAEGRAEGEAKGRAEVLLKQLTLKFGEPSERHRARLARASVAELDTWAERVLFATTLEQLFGEQ